MSIKDDLDDELKDAMRAHDQNRTDVVRQIKTEVTRALKAPGYAGEADDDLYRTPSGLCRGGEVVSQGGRAR